MSEDTVTRQTFGASLEREGQANRFVLCDRSEIGEDGLPDYEYEITTEHVPSNLSDLAREVYERNCEKGFWPPERNFGEALALIHSEVSEALEYFRDGHAISEVWFDKGKPHGIPFEFADIIIRVLDLCGAYGIPIDELIKVKHVYNNTRPYKHGRTC